MLFSRLFRGCDGLAAAVKVVGEQQAEAARGGIREEKQRKKKREMINGVVYMF